jgi:hypothetical protein
MNPYAYGANNPLAYVDADGRFAPLVLGLIGAVVGGGYYLTHHKGSINWTEFALWTVGGGLIGAAAGFAPTILGLWPDNRRRSCQPWRGAE